jgi:hypothetical protein
MRAATRESPIFAFGLLLSFFQLSRLAIRRLPKAFARREGQISFWIVGG